MLYFAFIGQSLGLFDSSFGRVLFSDVVVPREVAQVIADTRQRDCAGGQQRLEERPDKKRSVYAGASWPGHRKMKCLDPDWARLIHYSRSGFAASRYCPFAPLILHCATLKSSWHRANPNRTIEAKSPRHLRCSRSY